MAIHKLSARRINKLTKNGAYGDGNNLWLQVRGASKVWIFRWKDRVTKKDRVIGLGPLRFITLDEARATAASYCRMLWEGKDPKTERDKRILDQQIAQGLARTVRQVVEEYKERIVAFNAPNTQISAKRMLRIVNRRIGDLPIAKINPKIIIDELLSRKPSDSKDAELLLRQPSDGGDSKDAERLLRDAELWVKKHPTAKMLQGQLIGLCGFAIDQGYIPTGYNPALWEHLKRSLPKPNRVHRTKHHEGVPYKKIGQFMKELRAYRHRGPLQRYQGRPPITLCLDLIALTAGRPGEARLAQWKEFDRDNMIWTVPPEHLKMGHIHGQTKRVPITKGMLAVLKHAEQIAYPKDSSEFHDGHKRGPIFPKARHAPDCSPEALVFPDSTNNAFAEAMLARHMRGQMPKWRPAKPHGFRTSLKDWWKANGFPIEWWEVQVDHRGDKLKRSYGDDDVLEERRGKMELWGEYCSKPRPEPKAGEIVNLSSKRRRSA
jgi:integrase